MSDSIEHSANTIDWSICLKLWKSTQADQPNYKVGVLVLSDPRIRAAPALDLVEGAYSMFQDQNLQPIDVATLTAYEIDRALFEEVELRDHPSQTRVVPKEKLAPPSPLAPSRILYASLARSGMQGVLLTRPPPSPVFALCNLGVIASYPDKGLARLGLGPSVPWANMDCHFRVNEVGLTAYGLTWSPAGMWTDARIHDAGSSCLIYALRGCEIWVTWPGTAENRQAYYNLAFSAQVANPSCFALLGVLQGLRVACVVPGHAFRVTPGMVHAVLTLEPSAHLGVDFVDSAEWTQCEEGMRWATRYSQMQLKEQLNTWSNTLAARAARSTYVLWKELFDRLKDVEDRDEILKKLDALSGIVTSNKKKNRGVRP